MSGIFGVPVGAAYHLVFALTHLLTPVAGSVAAVAAIIVFTAAVRLLIAPLSLRALRGQAATARLAPQVQVLRKRHAGEPERLQRELAALYQREGASPLGGFLPRLLQWPFLSVMYLLFRSATVDGGPNQLLSSRLLGVPLGSHWLPGASLVSGHDAVFLGVFALLAGLCWLTARLARRMTPVPAAPSAAIRAGQDQAETVPGAKTAGGLGRGLRRVRPPGRGAVPAHHRRLDARRAPRLPAPHRPGRPHHRPGAGDLGAGDRGRDGP